MTASMSTVFCFGFILVCQVAVHGSAKVSMSTVFGSSSTAEVLSSDNTLAPSSFSTDTLSSVSAYPDPTVTTPYPVTSSLMTPTPTSSVTKTPTLPIQPGHRLITQTGIHTLRTVHPLVVPTLTSTVTPTPTLSLPQVETSSAVAKQVSRKLNTNGMFLEKLVQNTRPDTTESPPLSGEYIAIIILSILCGIVLLMIIIYILCKHRCCRVRFQLGTIRCVEELSSSEVSLEDGLPDGYTNMANSASVSFDGTGQTSFIGTDVQNSSLQNLQLEETAQDPSNQDMRQNNVTEFRHIIQSDYMDLSYFTSNSDKGETDTLNEAGCGGPRSGDAPAVKDEKSKPVENHSSNRIGTNEAGMVYTDDKPATGTRKRPKLFYDKHGYTLVIKNGDNQFRIAEESDHTNPLKDSTSYPHNHGVESKVGHNATVNSPVAKHKSKPFSENVLLPKTKLVERLVGSSQSDLHTEEANHNEDPPVSPQIQTHAFNHYLDLYSQIDDDSRGKNGEMDLVEDLSTETEENQSGETHLQNTGTDIEHAGGCAISNTTTTSSNVLLESLDILQGWQETTPSTDANSDYHSSGEDTSPEEDIDIMAYLGDYVAPKKTYLGIIYEYEEDVDLDEPDSDQRSECDDSEKEEPAKEQINIEHANSLKQESDRMKTDEAMKGVNTATQEGIEDEDTVGNLEILHTHQMNDENQADTEGVQKQVHGEAEADSVDKQSADEGATESCSETVDYQGLIQTTEGDDLVVDRDIHTYPHDLQGKVMYIPDIGSKDIQRPEAVKSEQSDETDTGDKPLVVKQEIAQEIAQEVAQESTQVSAQEVSQESTQDVAEEVAQEVVEEVTQEVVEEVAQEVVEEVTQEVVEEVAQEVVEEVAQEVVEEVAQEVVEEVTQEKSSEKHKEQKIQLEKDDVEMEEAKTDDECNIVGNEQTEKLEDLVEVQERDNQQIPGIPENRAEQEDENSRDMIENRLVEVNCNEEDKEEEEEEAQSDTQEKKHKDDVIDPLENEDRTVIEEARDTTFKEENISEIENEETVKFQHEPQENSDGQVKTDGDFDERADCMKDTIIEEAETDNPRSEQVLEGQDEMTETGTDQQIQEDFVRAEDQPKEDEAKVGIEMDGDEQENHVDEAEKEKCFEDKSYDTAENGSQITHIANCTHMETNKEHYDDGNAEAQQSSDGVAIQETTESVIHLEAKNEIVGENLQQEGKMKENNDKQHEATENNSDLCDGSRDILFLDTEEAEDEYDDDDGWMDLDEPISMVLAACQFSSTNDSGSDEMGCEGARPFDSNTQDEGAQVLDNCFARDYVERLQFLQPTKGILRKEGETGTINGGKRVSKKVRFILPDEWNTC